MAQINYDHIRSMLNMPDLTNTAIQTMLESKGVKSEAGAEKWASSNAAPGQPSFWSKVGQGYEAEGKGLLGLADKGAHLLAGGMFPSPTPAAPKPESAKQKADAAKAAEEAAAKRTKALQQQVATSPWTVMADYVAQQYQQASQASQGLINPYAGGQNSMYAQEAGAATQNALALTGMGGNAGGWLAQQQAAANAVTGPVQAAMAQEQGVYAKEAGPISNAVMAFGQANALGEITAPEMSWLNALSQHITSNLSYYGEVPTAALPTFEANPALGTAIQQSGGYGGAGGAGLTPVASVPTLAGTPKAASTSGFPGVGGTTSFGSIPSAGGTPSS